MSLLWLVIAGSAGAQVITLEGEVTAGLDHDLVAFEVPAGIAELEVVLDDGSEDTILDWGLDDPSGHRGWGGGNTEPAVLNAEAASRSYLPGPIVEGTWHVVVGKAKLASDPAPYTITVTLRDSPTLAAQPERRPYVPSPPLRDEAGWYRGDLHVHSRESGDARPDLDAIADLARSQGLDFVVVTDHNVVSGADFLVDAQARHPDVLLLPGIEVTTYDGHANALGATAWVDHRIGQPGVTIDAAAAAVTAQGALLSINHPTLDLGGACIGCSWTHDVPAGVSAVEVGNGGWLPVGQLFTPSAVAFWEDLAGQGHRLAAVGGSDDHKAGEDLGAFDSPIGMPTTWVHAEELSHEAILAGIAAGRTMVALDGPDSPVVTWSSSGVEVDGTYVGDEQTVSLTVTGEAEEVHWFVDGVDTATDDLDDGAAEISLTLTDTPTRVRAEVWIDDRPTVLTSHLWLVAGAVPDTAEPTPTGTDTGPGDAGGTDEPLACSDDCDGTPCSCQSASSTPWGAALFVAAALLLRRRRSVE